MKKITFVLALLGCALVAQASTDEKSTDELKARIAPVGQVYLAGSEPVVAAPITPERPMVDAAAVRANELGRIPVVMYHDVNDKVGKNTRAGISIAGLITIKHGALVIVNHRRHWNS